MSNQDHDGYEGEAAKARAFALRAMEILFGHFLLFLLPIVALTSLGVYRASQISPTYEARGVLSTATNPLLEDQQVRGVTLERFETPAQGTSRIINEQLRTDAFTEQVVERVGLADAVEAGLIDLDTVRNHLSTAPDGSSLLAIRGTWGDPVTAYQLVNGVFDTYLEYLADTVASDSTEAVSFYEGLRDTAIQERNDAQDELEDYLSTLPVVASEQNRPIAERLRIDDLTSRINDADDKVSQAEQQIDEAHLAVIQSRSNAGRSVQVIDEPEVPTAPRAAMPQRITTVGGMFMLGVFVALGALLIATILDHSVSTVEDLTALPEISLVVLVPRSGKRRESRRKRRRRSARKGRARAEQTPDSDDASDTPRPLESAST